MTKMFWAKLLAIEGFLLVGFAAGWAAAIGLNGALRASYYLLAIGLFALFMAFLLSDVKGFFRKQKSSASPKPKDFLRPVSMSETERALAAFGAQPPLFSNEHLSSLLVNVEGATEIPLAPGEQLVLENWNSDEIEVQGDFNLSCALAAQQIVRVHGDQTSKVILNAFNSGASKGPNKKRHFVLVHRIC